MMFFDREKFENVTGSEAGDEYTRIVEKLLSSGKVRKVIVTDERRVSYVSSRYKPEKKITAGNTVIFGPKDIIPLYFSSFIKRKLGVRNYFYLYMGELVTAFTGKKKGKVIEVTKIIGDRKNRETIRKEMNRMGYALTFR